MSPAKTTKTSTLTKIPFRLKGIKTEEFAVIEGSYKEGERIGIRQQLSFGYNPEKNEVVVSPRYEYHQSAPFMIISISCVFNIHLLSWGKWFDEKSKKLVIPKQVALHLTTLAVGTTRGVLHSKTEGTIFNRFFLPTWNLTEAIIEDCVIDGKSQ